MITNPNIIENKYECNEKVMRYLVFKCGIPSLGYSKNRKIWYFTKNEKLEGCLKKMPIWLKISAFFKN